MRKQNKHKFKYLFFEGRNYNKWFDLQDDKESEDEESEDDKTFEGDTPQESDEEVVKEEKGMKILTANKQSFNQTSNIISTNKIRK